MGKGGWKLVIGIGESGSEGGDCGTRTVYRGIAGWVYGCGDGGRMGNSEDIRGKVMDALFCA